MNTGDRRHPDEMLDAFLDGVLPPDEQARMQARVATDADLKAQVQRQTAVDASLARLFAPPVAPTVQGRPSPRRPAKTWLRPKVAAIAAIILVGIGCGMWALSGYLFPSEPPYTGATYLIHRAPTTIAAEYHALVKGGFKPEWVCRTQGQFAQTFQTNLGEPLLFDDASPAIKMVGLSYANVLSEHTIVFLGTIDGAQALVFVDRLQNDRPQTLPDDSGLHLFREQVGGLVLYEVTPLDKPSLLKGFHQPLPHCE